MLLSIGGGRWADVKTWLLSDNTVLLISTMERRCLLGGDEYAASGAFDDWLLAWLWLLDVLVVVKWPLPLVK
jgi:hypothetical protein